MRMPVVATQEGEEEILHFSLSPILPLGNKLALNLTLGTLSHMSIRDKEPFLVMEQQFTVSELCVLLPLLDAHPYYCPYEVLLASFNNGHVAEEQVEKCRERLQEALEEGVWDNEMRPVRNVLSRTRLKTRMFGIEISSILETGYILMYVAQRRQKVS